MFRSFFLEKIEFLLYSVAERSFRNNNSITAGSLHTKQADYHDRSESGALPKKGIESGKNIGWEYRAACSLDRWTSTHWEIS